MNEYKALQKEPVQFYTPEWAIELGKSLYICDTNNGEVKISAESFIEGFKYVKNIYPEGSIERNYLEKLEVCSTGLHSGLKRADKRYEENVESTTQERDKSLERLAKRGFLGKALENIGPLATGVAAFMTTSGILKYFDIDIGPELELGASFTAGYTVAETVDKIEELLKSKKIRRVTSRYDTGMKDAGTSKRGEKTKEYLTTLERSRRAYMESFGHQSEETTDISSIFK